MLPPPFPLYEILCHPIPLLVAYKSKEDNCTADLVKYLCVRQVPVHVHPAFTPPYLFPIGEVAITYTATDSSGNQASCTFHVRVIGKSSPNHAGGLQKQSTVVISVLCPVFLPGIKIIRSLSHWSPTYPVTVTVSISCQVSTLESSGWLLPLSSLLPFIPSHSSLDSVPFMP